MPPRYAYWTIIVDDQPTAFRAGALDDIMPTFNRLKEKQPTAKLMWFQSGKLWPSRIDAREAMQVRGERGRYSDPRQDGGDKTPARERPKWKSKDFSAGPGRRSASPHKPSSPERSAKPEWNGPSERVRRVPPSKNLSGDPVPRALRAPEGPSGHRKHLGRNLSGNREALQPIAPPGSPKAQGIAPRGRPESDSRAARQARMEV